MSSPRVAYISGPMSGLPDFNHGAFDSAAAGLRAQGWVVLSPAEHDGGAHGHPREHYMRFDLQQVLMATAVYVLDGWANSQGARLEVAVAQEIGLPVFHLDGSPLRTEAVRTVGMGR